MKYLALAALCLIECKSPPLRPSPNTEGSQAVPQQSLASSGKQVTTKKDGHVKPQSTETPARNRLDFSPVSEKSIRALQHKIVESHPVTTRLLPYCTPLPQAEPDSIVPRQAWLSPKAAAQWVQLRTEHRARTAFLGAVPDEKLKKLILVFEPDFTDWKTIQEVTQNLKPLPVELRPACHTKLQRQQAHAVLEQLRRGPLGEGKFFRRTPDASIGGWRVHVDNNGAELAKEIKKQLGSIVNLWVTFAYHSHSGAKEGEAE